MALDGIHMREVREGGDFGGRLLSFWNAMLLWEIPNHWEVVIVTYSSSRQKDPEDC